MNWVRTLKRYGWQVEEHGVEYDPFALLVQQIEQDNKPYATVRVHTDNGIDYGQVKCGVSVTIHCPQNEKSMDMAVEIAFRKALELTNAGSSQLEIPPLPSFQEPP